MFDNDYGAGQQNNKGSDIKGSKDKLHGGELFDPSGMSLYISYSAYSRAWVYSDFSYDKTEPLTTADTAVTFDYRGFKVQQRLQLQRKNPVSLA